MSTKGKNRVLKVGTACATPWEGKKLFADVEDLDAIMATQNYRLLKRKRVDKLKKEILEDGMRRPALLEYRRDEAGQWKLFCRQGHHRLQAVKELKQEKPHLATLLFQAMVQFNFTGASTIAEDMDDNDVEAASIIDRARGWHKQHKEGKTYEQIARGRVDARTVERTIVIAQLPEVALELLNENLDELKENTVKQLAREYVRDLGKAPSPEAEAVACTKVCETILAAVAKRHQELATRKQARSSTDGAAKSEKDGSKKESEGDGNVDAESTSRQLALDTDRHSEQKVTVQPAPAPVATPPVALVERTEHEAARCDAAPRQAPAEAATADVVSQPAPVEAASAEVTSPPAPAEAATGDGAPVSASKERKPRAATALPTASLKYRKSVFNRLRAVLPPEALTTVAEVLELPAAVKAAVQLGAPAESA